MSKEPGSGSIISIYNGLLAKHPLLVKSITGALLSSLGELISQWTTILYGSYKSESTEKYRSPKAICGQLIREPKILKVLVMFCYGGLINAPINHFMYRRITAITGKYCKSAKARSFVQLLAALSIVSPLQVLFLVAILTINTHFDGDVNRLWTHIKRSVKSKYVKILTSSCVSTTVLVSFAQKYIEPEKWSVFFSFAYAILGTSQNIYLKLKK
ncbi:hypothetical protein HG536_0G02410 [Torulaspora globosa]|uniref:Uncharacterized protein n=1 Tax=Torulaspora globosa TaxID=48254 RepID=A0A7G3ZLJ4_9SACH|nr:uncharacterized protein HG536_0G02410 [Torulaspora globosa]QLL34380.1 hypothetical protein HG536_0G02410 [Torulaspora globosa]